MKCISMGLNTEPDWIKADVVIERWRADGNEEMVAQWERARVRSEELRDKIIETVEAEGGCQLSWSCSGRTRHSMHAHQWAEALPQYHFMIGDNYECLVSKR